MIQTASKYSDVRAVASRPPSTPAVRASVPPRRGAQSSQGAPAVIVPKAGEMIGLEEWFWRELREGGYLHEYLRREKVTSDRRMRNVAKQLHGRRQNNKSDWRLLAAVPAREYQRWKREDPHFWEDDNNLRSFRRSNADACVYL